MMSFLRRSESAAIRSRQSALMVSPISMRVHVKEAQEYHSRAYAVRVMADRTELLVADKDRKLMWIDSASVEVVEPGLISEHPPGSTDVGTPSTLGVAHQEGMIHAPGTGVSSGAADKIADWTGATRVPLFRSE